jgi:hypothetical protein
MTDDNTTPDRSTDEEAALPRQTRFGQLPPRVAPEEGPLR